MEQEESVQTLHSTNEAATEEFAEALARSIGGEGVLLLTGNLGVGKTVFVRGLAAALGIDRDEIQSPTYTLMHEHSGPTGTLVHVDLYRLKLHEVGSLGLDEIFAGPGLVAIEWPDRLGEPIPGAWHVTITRLGEGQREIRLERRA